MSAERHLRRGVGPLTLTGCRRRNRACCLWSAAWRCRRRLPVEDAAEQRATQAKRARPRQGPRRLELTVPMHCGNCAQRIQDRVGALAGVQAVRADHQRDVVTIEHTSEVFEGQIRAKLHQMGFDVAGHADGEQETSP